MKTLQTRLIIVLVAFIVAVILILPTANMMINGKKAPDLIHSKKINLGLDLQGGMHLVLDVKVDKAVENQILTLSQELKTNLKKEKVRFRSIKLFKKTEIEAVIPQENADKFSELVKNDFSILQTVSSTTENDQTTVYLKLLETEADQTRTMAAAQALETIRNRIDEFGVSEPNIRRQGDHQILIQLPGVTDTKRAKALIGRTALLEFKLVDESVDVKTVQNGNPPPGTEILYEYKTNHSTGQTTKIPFLVKKKAELTGSHLTDARVRIDSRSNRPNVGITFDKKGARIFAHVTEANVNHKLAIVLDKKIYSAPNIQEKIPGGEGRITGNFSMEEARDLAIALRAGALPAPVEIVEERTVGPSLGRDSIEKGFLSMCIGGLLVVLFMLIYYKGAGLIADFALIMNILLMAAGLAGLEATLTLPGIAGIILTIGMAVDANVIIYERIREELNLGKTPRAAVDAGYDRATLTILDANVTTLIAALVLFQFGTGPVKGFAVTLSLGVLSSLFTALIVSRLIFDYILVNRQVKTLSI